MTLTARWDILDINTPAVKGTYPNTIQGAFDYARAPGNAAAGQYVYAIDKNAAIPNQILNNGAKLMLLGLGDTPLEITPSDPSMAYFINVTGASTTLTLGKNITLRGGSTRISANFVTVTGAGTFVMLEDSKITGYLVGGSYSATVSVDGSNDSTFHMKGGIITGNSSNDTSSWVCAGVAKGNTRGRIIMEGGSIYGNTCTATSAVNTDVFIENATGTGDLMISGNATIGGPTSGRLLIGGATGAHTTLSTSARININKAWTGNIYSVGLRGTHSADRVFVVGSNGYTLTAEDIAKIQGGTPGGRTLQLNPTATTNNYAILKAAP